jgi:hypothetical protein
MIRYPRPKIEWTGQSTIDQFFKLYGKVKPEIWVAFCIKYLEYGLKDENVVALLNELWMIPPL